MHNQVRRKTNQDWLLQPAVFAGKHFFVHVSRRVSRNVSLRNDVVVNVTKRHRARAMACLKVAIAERLRQALPYRVAAATRSPTSTEIVNKNNFAAAM